MLTKFTHRCDILLRHVKRSRRSVCANNILFFHLANENVCFYGCAAGERSGSKIFILAHNSLSLLYIQCLQVTLLLPLHSDHIQETVHVGNII